MANEISLREIIQDAWRNKIWIALVIICAMFIAGGYSYMQPSIFESTSIVSLVPSEKDAKTSDLSSAKEQVKSKFTTSKIINGLKLDPTKYTIDSLMNNISVESLPNSSYISIKVKGTDNQVTTDIANLLAFSTGSNIEILKHLSKQTEQKAKLEEVKSSMQIVESELNEVSKLIQVTPQILNTKKALADDTYLVNGKQLGALQLSNEEINPVYLSLQSRQADATVQKSKLNSEEASLNEDIQSHKKTIAELEQQSINGKPYDFNYVMITPAIVPAVPIGPAKLITTVLGGAIALLLALFFLVIRAYWIRNQTSN
ncbi:Wzz/FepE/Etk N-terminal domain-containing protein [Paenibacillus sp. HJGM_3]|uniref:Wzz/FepE/Etk N-terminal domain-containing protein n=1 Tax=Paenibacillus sp. HJGM_3 TaxID=3379816 RepID=UPI003858FEAC